MEEEGRYRRGKLTFLDIHLRNIVDQAYDTCMHKCCLKDKEGSLALCKQFCYKHFVVNYKFANHMSRQGEDQAYAKCIAEKMPNLDRTAYFTCTKDVYAHRVKVLSDHIAKVGVDIMNELH